MLFLISETRQVSDPVVKHLQDQAYVSLGRALLFEAVEEAYTLSQRKYANVNQSIRNKNKVKSRPTIRRQKQRMRTWINTRRFVNLTTALGLDPDKARVIFRDLLAGRNTEAVGELLKRYRQSRKGAYEGTNNHGQEEESSTSRRQLDRAAIC